MDRSPPAGSIARARERAAAGLPREDRSPPRSRRGGSVEREPQNARPSRPQAPPGLQTKDGQIGVAISRPTPVPQWPLASGPIIAAPSVDGEPYRPPPGKSQPPQRPPRPSRVPSILDGSKVQDYTPVFQYRPRSTREPSGQELLPVPETPSSVSRASTQSSVGSIPDFPIPAQIPPGPPRRSVNLGPPPSARRGVSSFYSNVSYVSPIPEESPRSRSHTSFASSAAMPESWGTPSPGPSPQYPEAIYDDALLEETGSYGDEEESRLVRNASIGKKAKPTLVGTAVARGLDEGEQDRRPGPKPLQTGPFGQGTGYVDYSSSSSTIPASARLPIGSAVTRDSVINALSSASADDPSNESQREEKTPSPQETLEPRQYSRLSAIRRPPRLDMDAVRKAEARGSLTSLPELIRRATKLAASLEKGKRPASRFDDLDYSGSEGYGVRAEKHQSGLSDMLAAFPPPAQPGASSSRRSIRNSIRDHVQSWPLPMNMRSSDSSREANAADSDPDKASKKKNRRCCGLPLWGFIVVMFVILVIIAAAIIIPLEFLVLRRQNNNNDPQAALQQCQQQLICANGGTNVVNDGVCSCICTGGFTGFDCTTAPSPGCTTFSLSNLENMSNVTVGDAIPRLIQQAQTNFSIPLNGEQVIAKLNAANMSCTATNALVIFDGSAVRQGAALAQVNAVNANAVVIDGVYWTTITIMAGQFTTITIDAANPLPTPTNNNGQGGSTIRTVITGTGTLGFGATISVRPTTTITPTVTRTVTTTIPLSSGQTTVPTPTPGFKVTEEVLDFARVAVLYVLQENNLRSAEQAQIQLQKLFSRVTPVVGVEEARNVTVGEGMSVDLVDGRVDLGRGVVGGPA
ncbi:hypothetical protein QBC40DRAFT_254755 [Triangularia verruculosa]|uniref:EGF-like domain-containing protein n=1 Tax=Triangularia verruculosa TaxID=2587418 RepID=A0AAN6XFL8_9PEZI|nr:hypothetical protein QBC40DRAFT_254755 [Triangularia verruculosa]